MEFMGKTVIITGAAVGIGKATAIQFAKNGATVLMIDINEDKLTEAFYEVKKFSNKVFMYLCDISDIGAVGKIFKDINAEFKQVDILVNNAALWRDDTLFTETSFDAWKKYFDVNVLGTIYMTKSVIENMINNQYGRIINVASVAGVYGKARMVHYSSTKGAVISFTKSLAKEVASFGITVNAVSPGTVSPAENGDIDFFEKNDVSYIGRTGTDRENADLILYLASDKAAYISGQNIQIDGCRKIL